MIYLFQKRLKVRIVWFGGGEKILNWSMAYKAVCTDIDGTLLNIDRVLSTRTIAAVGNLPDDLPFILASSRMPQAMEHLQYDLGISGHPLICYNGAYVLVQGEGGRQQILHDEPISVEIARKMSDFGAQNGLHVALYRDVEWHVPSQDEWSGREERNTKVSASLSDMAGVLDRWEREHKGPHKIMCMGDEALINKAEDFLWDNFPDQCHLYRSKATYLEIAPKSISKASALEKVLQHLGNIELNEVIAFGDNYNDIDMLESVGLGIAVGNARTEVKASANETTLKSKEDGVAAALEKYFS